MNFGQASDQTGQIVMFNSSSVFATTFQAGNASAAVTYTLPTAGPSSNGQALTSTTVGVMSWATYPALNSAFVTIGNDATLTGERALTGTANQITVTDNGANSSVVLSTPQNIHTGASPTFAGLTLSGALLGADGLVGTPQYSFTNDPDTGMFRPGANSLNLVTGGTSRVAVSATDFLVAFGGNAFLIDGSTTAGDTRMMVYDVDNAALERVTVGAADSGGVGFKVLRIPN